MNVPASVLEIMEELRQRGYEVYAVGGCVRDSLLSLEPKDWDLTTNALPEEIAKVFKDYRVIDTGIRFGTVGIVTDTGTVEVTTYRTEYGYADSRHPDDVSFVSSLAEDLKRRDFTINAMAYTDSEGIVDLFGGREDLKNNLLRAVGEPLCRFQEDALRIMRGLRFASRYGFKIEDTTAKAMFEKAYGLKSVATERIMTEFKGFIQGKSPAGFIEEFFEIFAVFIPELKTIKGFKQNSPYHNSDVMQHTLRVVDAVPDDLSLRLSALFHDIGKPLAHSADADGTDHFYGHEKISAEITRKILNRLRFDKNTISEVCDLIESHMIYIQESEKAVKRILSRLGEDKMRKLIKLQRADNIALAPPYNTERMGHFDEIEKILDKVIAEKACFKIKDLDITGRDLIELGIPEGREVGAILSRLLEAVIEENLENKREVLIKYVINKKTC